MNESVILKKFLAVVTPNMHKVRRKSLESCVASLLNGAHASVTSIGRGILSPTYEKHRIKQADRLLSNEHLQHEAPNIYNAIYRQFASHFQRPTILVDWSDLDSCKGNFLLRASVAFDGRGITLYQEIHGLGTKESRQTHQLFLKKIFAIIGDKARPIIVTDAGFKTTWFNEVTALGWDFVGRVRKPMMYKTKAGVWEHITDLYPKANTRAKCFTSQINRSKPMPCRLILYKAGNKGRHSLTKLKVKRRSKTSLVHAKGAKDPWLLATSLEKTLQLGRKAVKIYRLRMQIEEEFRDIKSSLFGLGFTHHKSRSKKRLSILLLIATLASIFANLIGVSILLSGLSRRYQANTVSGRRVLSFHFLGLRAIKDMGFKLLYEQFEEAKEHVKQTIARNAYG